MRPSPQFLHEIVCNAARKLGVLTEDEIQRIEVVDDGKRLIVMISGVDEETGTYFNEWLAEAGRQVGIQTQTMSVGRS